MGDKSSIEWTEATWNPVTGCTKVSPGCKHCYAETMAKRLKAMGRARRAKKPDAKDRYRNGFKVTLHPDVVDQPLRWTKPRLIFVNSMSDLFHDDVPLSFICRVFRTMCYADQHTFQVLTKRSDRLRKEADLLPWPDNVWMGVSVESPGYYGRIWDLQKVDARVRFLSCEPLLRPLPHLPLKGIDWVIVGGESGPHARTMNPDWVREIRDQCVDANVPFFFKQWGGRDKKAAGRELDGRTWDEMPRRREVWRANT